MIIQKVLLAYDGSEGAKLALKGLRHCGLNGKVQVLVLTAVDAMPLPPSRGKEPKIPEWISNEQTKARQRIQREVLWAQEQSKEAVTYLKTHFRGWKVASQVVVDSPAWAIINKAELMKADLIVMGAHGTSAAARLFLGSVSQKVAMEAKCNVHVIRGDQEIKKKSLKILIALDGSIASHLAVKRIAERIWTGGTEIHLVTAVDHTVSSAVMHKSSPVRQWIKDNLHNNAQWVDRMVRSSVEKLREKGYAVSFLVKEGDAKQVILEEARVSGVDLVVMGNRGLGLIKRMILGSVSTAVLSRAHCSVEVIKK